MQSNERPIWRDYPQIKGQSVEILCDQSTFK